MKWWKIILTGIVSISLAACSTAAYIDSGQSGTGMQIEDGMAKPILQYSSVTTDNKDSEILRFCVYVETDYDTDGDGKADLVKAFVQVPRKAVEGEYQAAVLYDPTPYAAGTVMDTGSFQKSNYSEAAFDKTKLYEPGKKRKSKGKEDTLTKALQSKASEWSYTVPGNETPSYNMTRFYDYYLIRGFAIVQAGGIGTYGSEGFELCGTDLERDSHKAVIEWLAGKRKAFTDTKNNIEIEADWSNRNVAMIGASYGGTLAYEVATTGVEGLKTVIPIAGIADWYNYSNSQGVSLMAYPHYTDTLASFNAGALFEDDGWYVPDTNYISWLHQQMIDEEKANGNYDETWEASNYAGRYKKIQCSALIIHGLNDFNVMTTQAKLIYDTFKKTDNDVKVILHQDGHNLLMSKKVDDQLFDELLNKWLCHYLLDVDNGIESMPEISCQSNLDGSWETANSWNDLELSSFKPKDVNGETIIQSQDLTEITRDIIAGNDPGDAYYHNLKAPYVAVYEIPLEEGSTISGTAEVHVKLSTENTDQDNLMVTAVLMDEMKDGSAFEAYNTIPANHYILPVKTVSYYEIGGGYRDGNIVEYVKSYTKGKAITFGWMDLLDPEAPKVSSLDTKYHTAKPNDFNNYTIEFTPTNYTLDKGHVLKLYILAQDPKRARFDESKPESYTLTKEDPVYSFTIDNASVEVKLPIRK